MLCRCDPAQELLWGCWKDGSEDKSSRCLTLDKPLASVPCMSVSMTSYEDSDIDPQTRGSLDVISTGSVRRNNGDKTVSQV